MPTEIERRFLVDPAKLSVLPSCKYFLQGYLSCKPCVRVRIVSDKPVPTEPGACPAAYLTIKGPGTIERPEFEYPIPFAEAVQLLDLFCGSRWISKKRYLLPSGWELDQFQGRHAPLWLAEYSFASSADVSKLPLMPPWIVEEVSQDPRYTNMSLAYNPYPF